MLLEGLRSVLLSLADKWVVGILVIVASLTLSHHVSAMLWVPPAPYCCGPSRDLQSARCATGPRLWGTRILISVAAVMCSQVARLRALDVEHLLASGKGLYALSLGVVLLLLLQLVLDLGAALGERSDEDLGTFVAGKPWRRLLLRNRDFCVALMNTGCLVAGFLILMITLAVFENMPIMTDAGGVR